MPTSHRTQGALQEPRATLRKTLCSAATVFSLFAVTPSVAAQSAVEAQFERMHAELLRAADAALAAAAAPPMSGNHAAPQAPRVEDPIPAHWRERLSAEEWKLMGRSLEAEGLPVGLLAVGWVESRFNRRALSPKGALGVWQLMPETARRYGLVVRRERDDRLDLRASSRAAARHLADLRRQYEDWPLALAAYNAGSARVDASLARAGASDFLRASRWLPEETRVYVLAVLATMDGLSENQQAAAGAAPR
jgi:membrane-bound lytic murein transglycosylase D